MFDELMVAAGRARGASAVGAWARLENAAAARRLAAMADLLESKLAELDSAERDQWCLDNWDAVSAEVAAGQGVSLGVASNELLVAWELRERLPRVSEVFAAGTISYRLAASVVKRTRLVRDREARAKIDIEIATSITGWGPLSKAKQESEIDYWVDRYDPSAVVRTEGSARSRRVDVATTTDGSGLSYIEAVLYGHDGEALDKRLDEMAYGVCSGDPRTIDQRRSEALGALGHRADRLRCLCGRDDCDAAQRTPSAVVVHVIAEEASLSDQTPVALNGAGPLEPRPESEPYVAAEAEPDVDSETEDQRGQAIPGSGIAQLLAPTPATGPALTNPAIILGGGLLPAPVLSGAVVGSATIRRLVHPGQSPPEPRYTPSAKLSDFVRCRDMTCRFPGCDVEAYRCDLDHTIAHPVGPTQASNLACLCRKHHLLKTFWGWRAVQSPVGTVVWTSPSGQEFTTHPGSRVLFPSLCRPTAPVDVSPSDQVPPRNVPSGVGMPRRRETRKQARARRSEEQRRNNEAFLARRGSAPPF